jgi:hypothetical protein
MCAMSLQYKFCPRCQGIRDTSVSIGLRKFLLPDGTEHEELMFHFHCASCNTYICSAVATQEELAQDENGMSLYSPPNNNIRIKV